MEKQFPKNVRQIGNVCDEPKIYVEDYVDNCGRKRLTILPERFLWENAMSRKVRR